MRKMFPVLLALLAIPAVAQAGEVIEVLSEDFESGLDAWTAEAPPYVDAFPDEMVVFPPGGSGMFGGLDDRYGLWGLSQCVGHSSAEVGGWDGTEDHWIQRQWTGLAPGTYSVTLEYDFYVYADIAHLNGGRWDVGNRVYLLTDEDFDFPCFNFDSNSDVLPGFKVDFWPGYENYLTCQDVGGGNFQCIGPVSGTGEQTCTVTSDCQNAGATPATWLYNGVWRRVTWQATVTTTTGNFELRLLKHEKGDGQETVAWDDLDLVIKDASEQVMIEYHDNFDGPDPLAGWTNMKSCLKPISNNDDAQIFAADDPLLYDNIDNPGSHSAGYSDYVLYQDQTDKAWLKRLFPNALPAGATGTMKLEFDWYVFDQLPNNGADNDSPTVFPAPDGAGIYGPNTSYPGSVSVGYASNLVKDGIRAAWIQQQYSAAVDPGTYKVVWTIDRYVYSENTSQWAYGNRIYILTDELYNAPTFNWDGGLDPDGDTIAEGLRKSWWNHENPTGTWVTHVYDTDQLTTNTGNIEIRLLADDKVGGPQTAAWDNMTLELKDPITDTVVWSITDDFEDGLEGWTEMVRPNDHHDFGDPWWLGTKVYVLTDDLYDEPDHNTMYNGQFQIARWPGDEPDLPEWDYTWNGHWRHWVVERPFTTVTGNIDVRLLQRQKYAGRPQASAWDNVKLSFILPCNVIRFDADNDGDVDQADFAVLQACYTGAGDPEGIFDADACRCVNSDGDSDIDVDDVTAFEACASGPGVVANVDCDNALSPP